MVILLGEMQDHASLDDTNLGRKYGRSPLSYQKSERSCNCAVKFTSWLSCIITVLSAEILKIGCTFTLAEINATFM